MAETQATKRWGIGLVAVALVALLGLRLFSKHEPDAPEAGDAAAPPTKPVVTAVDAGLRARIGAPIAAARGANGEVLVAGVDGPSGTLRIQRYDAHGNLVKERAVLDAVKPTTDAELKMSAHPTEGIALTWRGLRNDKLVRQLVVLAPDLGGRGDAHDVAAVSCTTRDGIWLNDGQSALVRPWNDGPTSKIALSKDDDASLLCGAGRAFAVLEGEERTSVLPVAKSDAGKASPMTMFRDSEFGDDEQREISEYTVGDDLGVVRVATSGAIAVRELVGDKVGPLHKLKTVIPKDDDVVAVDASEKLVAIVYTQDASSTCSTDGAASPVSTKVTVLRVDRKTFEESTVEVNAGRCGDEIGPFFTGAVGDDVSVAWTERRGGPGRARAPIVGLAHTLVGSAGAPAATHVDQPADALADASCDQTGCAAAALLPQEAAYGGGGGQVRILRYNGKP